MSALEAYPLEPVDLTLDDPEDAHFERSCRECGCSDRHACYRPDWGCCSWADRDLCSHCLPLVQERRRKRAWRAACLVFVALWATLVTLSWLSAPAPPLRGRLEPAPTHTPIRPGVRGAPWAVNT